MTMTVRLSEQKAATRLRLKFHFSVLLPVTSGREVTLPSVASLLYSDPNLTFLLVSHIESIDGGVTVTTLFPFPFSLYPSTANIIITVDLHLLPIYRDGHDHDHLSPILLHHCHLPSARDSRIKMPAISITSVPPHH